jgi:photosystem II stability/assembly factor-like uncharacterized protein
LYPCLHGTKLAACIQNSGYIYTSSDSGSTWTRQNALEEEYGFTSIVSSSDGARLAVMSEGGDYIFSSSDTGVTWSKRVGMDPGIDSYSLYSITISGEGSDTKIAAGGYGQDDTGYYRAYVYTVTLSE